MRNNPKKILQIGSLIFIFLFIAGYTYYRTRDLWRGVVLTVNDIKDGESFTNPSITIAGVAKNSKSLYLDGREIYVDRDWNFKESLILSPGYNIIEIKAFDKFNGSVLKNYQLIKS